MKANPGKLQQVFINLLINAAQAIENGRRDRNRILIRTGRRGQGFFVEIRDTGQGIPESIRAHIFDSFFTTKPIGVGTGLGLSICQEIVKRYHGTLEAESEAGNGAVFTVFLPGCSAAPEEEKAAPPAADVPWCRVLVVDDEPANLEILSKHLKKNNEVLSALTGLDALDILKREGGRVDSIVTDIHMPDMNGIGLYRAIARQFPGLEKRIVFVTGNPFSPETQEFFKTVSNPCLEKPFNHQELLDILASWKGFS